MIQVATATNPVARFWPKSKSKPVSLLAKCPYVVKRHGCLTGRKYREVERFAECEVGTAVFAYKSEVVSNRLDKREHHPTGFRIVKAFVHDILSARCLSYCGANNSEMTIEVV